MTVPAVHQGASCCAEPQCGHLDRRPSRWHRRAASSHALDGAFLCIVVAASTAHYLSGLGFYSDDWTELARLRAASDSSVGPLFRSVFAFETVQRPGEAAWWVALFTLGGLDPHIYHLANTAVLMANAVLLYLAGRSSGWSRLLALSVSTVWSLLPHYSAVRFWVSASPISLSVGFYLVSLCAELWGWHGPVWRRWCWRALSLLALLASTLTYELVVPLFFVTPVLVAWRRSTSRERSLSRWTDLVPRSWYSLLYYLVLLSVITFKLTATERLPESSPLLMVVLSAVRAAFDWHYGAYDYGFNIKQALETHFGDYGVGLPFIVWQILTTRPDPITIGLSVLIGVGVAGYLAVTCNDQPDALRTMHPARLIALGVCVFFLGYAIFLTNQNVQFSTTGIANRTAIAATAGSALAAIGFLSWISRLAPSEGARRTLYCLLTALLSSCGVLINDTLAVYWLRADREQQTVLATVHQALPDLPSGSTLLLDGICPYVGPAIVFEADWDVTGALRVLYGINDLNADVVTSRMMVTRQGLTTTTYSHWRLHPYPDILLYNIQENATDRLPDVEAATAYFETFHGQDMDRCPPGYEGHGVAVFPSLFRRSAQQSQGP